MTDLQLGATDSRYAEDQMERLQPSFRSLLRGQTLYTTLDMYPTLMLDRGPDPDLDPEGRLAWLEERDGQAGPQPVKTVPDHHAAVRLADEADVEEIFPGDFIIGHTIEQGHPVRPTWAASSSAPAAFSARRAPERAS